MMAVKIDRAAQRGESDIMGEWFVSTYKPQPFFVVDNFHDASEDELQLENSERNSSPQRTTSTPSTLLSSARAAPGNG